jgi:type VI secretion system secreted protein Hcp
MAYEAYVAIKGNKQGQFKGESTEKNRKDKWIPVLAFEMELDSPRDQETGQASGKRQFSPVSIVKEWGAASPQALTACATNEVLNEVTIEFTRLDADGADYVYQSVTLANAVIERVARVKGRRLEGEPPGGTVDPREWEEWEFTFQKIELVDNDGQTSFADDWVARS